MMIGFGWIHLQTSREVYNSTSISEISAIDDQIESFDDRMFNNFRSWINQQGDPFFLWNLADHNNNHCGLLTFSLSRNHRTSVVWDVLDWVIQNAPGSYGLFYCHDDEDSRRSEFDNVYRGQASLCLLQ